MTAYADSSFLAALYLPEPESPRVIRWVSRATKALPYTPLHRHEIRTGMRQRVFRKLLSEKLLHESWQALDSDLEEGVLAHTPIPWTDSFRESELIGLAHGTNLPMRSLNLLHVGIAVALGAATFLTVDARQRAIAQAAGLRVDF